MILKKKGIGAGGKGKIAPEGGGSSAPRSTGHGTVKYVELWGSLASLAAGLSTKIIDYTIPDGHAAELYALGVVPDFDPVTATSNLLNTEIGFDGKLTGIKFLTNNIGMNSLPYGDRASKQPMRLLDYPMQRGSLTPKYNEGMKVQIVVTAGASSVTKQMLARARLLLYEEDDAQRVFGIGISALATIPGGVSQALPHQIFAEYALLATATAGKGQWETLYENKVQDFEQIMLSHVGVKPHGNGDAAKLFDLRNKKEFPEYEPYWKVNDVYNAMPFGDDEDFQPMFKLPSPIADYLYTNTTLRLLIRDLSAVIPIGGISVQLVGTYRRVR